MSVSDVIELLDIFEGGQLSVTADGVPLSEIDVEKKTVSLEMQGLEETGIKLSGLISAVGDDKKTGLGTKAKNAIGTLRESGSIAKKLSEEGWAITLYDKSERVLSIGYGSSGLTGHLSISPRKIGKLFKLI